MKTLLALMMVLCCAGGAFATTYNMTDDWTSYPSSPTNWSYGVKAETAVNSGIFGAFSAGTHMVDPWWLDKWVSPETFVDGSYQTWIGMSAIDIWIPINKVTGTPWVNWAAVAHFTGAEDGTYNLSTIFNGLPTGGTGTKTVYIQKNDVTILSATFSGLDTVRANWQMSLISTDYVDFIITDTGTSSCSTQMDATLTLIPEPTTMILLGVGGLVFLRDKYRIVL